MDRTGQYVPAAQTDIVLVFWQNDPTGQGLSVVDPAGQKPPMLQESFDEGVEQ